jgi:hypothetical protein
MGRQGSVIADYDVIYDAKRDDTVSRDLPGAVKDLAKETLTIGGQAVTGAVSIGNNIGMGNIIGFCGFFVVVFRCCVAGMWTIKCMQGWVSYFQTVVDYSATTL